MHDGRCLGIAVPQKPLQGLPRDDQPPAQSKRRNLAAPNRFVRRVPPDPKDLGDLLNGQRLSFFCHAHFHCRRSDAFGHARRRCEPPGARRKVKVVKVLASARCMSPPRSSDPPHFLPSSLSLSLS